MNKEETKEYMRAYGLKRRKLMGRQTSKIPLHLINPIIHPIPEELEEYFFTGNVEPICCEVFGCGKTLTIQEKLFGNKCSLHSIKRQRAVGSYFK